ncbi:hypothetical protein A6R68_04372, partial [Neotoma lepida]
SRDGCHGRKCQAILFQDQQAQSTTSKPWHYSYELPHVKPHKISEFKRSLTPHNEEIHVAVKLKKLHFMKWLMLPNDRDNLSCVRDFLSLIQSSTHRAYCQIMGVLDQNCRPVIGATPLPQYDTIRYSTSSSFDTAMEASLEEMTAVDAASLRRQIIKLNRRLQHLEEENKERAKREMFMYSVTVAFWLLNTWLLLRR